MQTYPTIPKIVRNDNIYAFDKLDGSNIRAEWVRKKGFVKFGTRRRLLDANERPLGEAVALINDEYADALADIFHKMRLQKATAFFEFYGAHSFAGFHEEEEHKVTLIDVHLPKEGIMDPRDFLKWFGGKVDTAPLLYQGKPHQDFVTKVQTGQLPGMTFEGVVCKGGRDKHGNLAMFKVKNRAWLEALKHKCGDDMKLYEALA